MIKPHLFSNRPLALFRMGLGSILLVDLLDRWGNVQAHYTDSGVFPREALSQIQSFPFQPLLGTCFQTPLALSGSTLWTGLWFALAGITSVLLLIGYRTKTMTVASWALILFIQLRNPLILYGADHLLRLLLFFSIFLPLGNAWSVDARLGLSPRRCHPVAVYAFTLQIVFVYVFTFLLKSDACWFPNGTAGLMATQIDLYAKPLAHALSAYPAMLRAGTFGVYAWELIGPLFLLAGVFRPFLRWLAVAGFTLLHAGLFMTFHLGFFPLISILSLVPFISMSKDSPHGNTNRNNLMWIPAIAISLIFLINIKTLPHASGNLPEPLHTLSQALRLEQKWNLFAPYPMTHDGRFEITATLEDQSTLQLLPQASFSSHRWRKYFIQFTTPASDPFIPYVKKWISQHPGYFIREPSLAPVQIEFRFYEQITRFDGTEEAPVEYRIFTWKKHGQNADFW